MNVGLERAPVYPFNEGALTYRGQDSAATFGLVLEHSAWLESQLGLGTDLPFRVGPEALRARHDQLERSKSESHCTSRGVLFLGKLVSGTVKEMEAEFARQTVLDIGCGDGRLGVELSRNAKSRVTFFDRDSAALSGITRKSGRKIIGEGVSLPFTDEAFDKTVTAFSSVAWAETPLETVNSLQEALRVTQVNGTCFVIPALSNVLSRRRLAVAELVNPNQQSLEDPLALKVWALQDHLAINTLLGLAEEGYCSISWSSFIGKGMNTGATVENYSAVVDKVRPIPEEVYGANLAYAKSFMLSEQPTSAE